MKLILILVTSLLLIACGGGPIADTDGGGASSTVAFSLSGVTISGAVKVKTGWNGKINRDFSVIAVDSSYNPAEPNKDTDKKITLTIDSLGKFHGTLPRTAVYNLFIMDEHSGEGSMIHAKSSESKTLFYDTLTSVGSIEGKVDQQNECIVLLYGTPFTSKVDNYAFKFSGIPDGDYILSARSQKSSGSKDPIDTDSPAQLYPVKHSTDRTVLDTIIKAKAVVVQL